MAYNENSSPTTAVGVGALVLAQWGGRKIKYSSVNGAGGTLNVCNFSTGTVAGLINGAALARADVYGCFSWATMNNNATAANTNGLAVDNSTNGGDVWIGAVANSGGFYWSGRMGLPTTPVIAAGESVFVGFRALKTNPAGGTIASNFVNCIGFGFDPGDTNLQFMNNDAAGACTKTDMGANLALAVSKAYFLEVFVLPNSSVVNFSAYRYDLNVVSTPTPVSTNLPATGTSIFWQAYCTSGVSVANVQVDFGSQFIDCLG